MAGPKISDEAYGILEKAARIQFIKPEKTITKTHIEELESAKLVDVGSDMVVVVNEAGRKYLEDARMAQLHISQDVRRAIQIDTSDLRKSLRIAIPHDSELQLVLISMLERIELLESVIANPAPVEKREKSK